MSYNDSNGGFCKGKLSEETKEKIREKALGHKRNIGHKVSKETRKKISIAHQGKKLSESTKDKIRNHPNIRGNHNRRKKLYQLDMDGNLLNTYDTTYEAQYATGVHRCNISACCNGRLTHAGQFKWTYNYGNKTY